MKRLLITVEDKTYEVVVEEIDATRQEQRPVQSTAVSGTTAPTPSIKSPEKEQVLPSASHEGEVLSPLSAVVVSIDVKVGQKVRESERLITLEAMKMNTFVNAPQAGTVDKILIQVGDSVEEGKSLLTLK